MQNETKKISKNTATYFIANAITKVAAFFLIPVYTIFLTPEEYGMLNIIGVTANFLFIFFILGLKGAIRRFSFDFEDQSIGQKKLIGIITIFTFIIGGTLSIFLTLFGNKIFPFFFKNTPFFPYLFTAIWIAFFRIAHQIKLVIFQVRQQAFFYTLLDSGFILANILLTIVVVVLFKKGLTGKIYLDFFLIALFSVISTILLIKDIKINFNLKLLKEPLKFALPLIPHMLSGFLLAAIDKIFIERITGLNDVGLYSLAFNIGMILYMFIEAIRLSYTPYFNKMVIKEGDSAKPKFAKLTTYGFLLYSVAGIFLILFSKELITIIANKEYYLSYSVLPIIILTNVFNGLYFFFVRPLLFFKNATIYVSIATLSTAVVNIILNYFFIKNFGMIGAAWATFISIIIKVILIVIFAQKKYFIKYEIKRLLILTFLIVVSIMFFYFSEIIETSIIKMIALKTLFFVLIAISFIFTRFFDKKEIKTAHKTISNFKEKYFSK